MASSSGEFPPIALLGGQDFGPATEEIHFFFNSTRYPQDLLRFCYWQEKIRWYVDYKASDLAVRLKAGSDWQELGSHAKRDQTEEEACTRAESERTSTAA
jgi:hypothetical protein